MAFFTYDTRFFNTSGSVGIIVEENATAQAPFSEAFLGEVELTGFTPNPAEPIWFNSYLGTTLTGASNQTDRDNYSLEINENIDTRGRLEVGAAHMRTTDVDTAELKRVGSTQWFGWHLKTNVDSEVLFDYQRPRDLNTTMGSKVFIWYTLEFTQGGGGDAVKLKLTSKYTAKDGDGKINSGGTPSEEVGPQVFTVPATNKTIHRLEFNLDSSLMIGPQYNISFSLERLADPGSHPGDTRNGGFVVLNSQLIYTKKIDKGFLE